jgi:hypothetical protein
MAAAVVSVGLSKFQDLKVFFSLTIAYIVVESA